MKRKPGQLLSEIRAALEERPEGMDAGELARHCGIERYLMAIWLCGFRKSGHMRATGGRGQRWFMSPTAPETRARNQPVTPPRGPRRAMALPVMEHVTLIGVPRTVTEVRATVEAAGLVLAPNVKITVCPGGLDTRFSVDPREFAGGDAMADWKRKRASRSQGLA